MPTINQRDVYLLPFPLESKVKVDNHLHIVLSVPDANSNENTFLAVMITSSDRFYDELSFDLTDGMFDKPLNKSKCHVRMHLITLALNREIIGAIGSPLNSMKKTYFDQLLKQIGELVFNFDFTPL